MSELLDAAIKAGDKIYFRGEKVESIEITRDKDEPPLKVDLAHTRASYLDTITEQLNENQQIVLEWLKGSYVQGYGAAVIRTIHLLQKENTVDISDSSYVRGAYRDLNTVEEAVVVKMFADWALEQEEE
ncbi:hypothetical protein [Enterococcus gallinarum]|uniref:hypothetical protein n=1 Tax=Enterococcus gallinarum TaxID=1353 RepID=UPI001C8B80B0|nr:hypothetical protein [Enterococcus gallinarum]MBX8978141.1 hypothetical protein [Enterococcus gallinarum]MDL4876865.1 hypothetical protein [Enterococcus gallinarum]MDL4922422.1 hypothetical protein [Enterococcus gallinarum]MDL4984124.1 hypothetical protein [Enterococcus gallinarum]MDL4987713.1 hypothetical protein [Enterococcus gallinarum]